MEEKGLTEWLSWIKTLHVKQIDLGLDRVKAVAGRLGLLNPHCCVVTVGGTNGKGSCVTALERIYLGAGYRVGMFNSPFMVRYNEQIRIQGNEVEDAVLCRAFSQITSVMDGVTLTEFEFGTLAAMVIFQESDLDIYILEVGLGGRLDAVNILDADVAVISSIALDHTEWLGDTRDEIAIEKAGIFRRGKPAVCGDVDPPFSLIEAAKNRGVTLYCQGRDFGYRERIISPMWQFWFGNKKMENLPVSSLALQNMSTVLAVVELLQDRFSMTREVIDLALKEVRLPGRIQEAPGAIDYIYDVSHNPAAVEKLADYLRKKPCLGKTHAVFSMYMDKDIINSISAIRGMIFHWHIAVLPGDRGAPAALLLNCFKKVGVEESVIVYTSIQAANAAAKHAAVDGDRIVVFGSFATVVAVQTEMVSVQGVFDVVRNRQI